MKANAPEKVYLHPDIGGREFIRPWLKNRANQESVEYVRADAFIEKAAEFLYNYNQKQVLKHGARATLGCGEYTINVDEFRKYMEGE